MEGPGLSRRVCAWQVAGHEVPGDRDKPPQPRLVQHRPPGPPGTCPGGCRPRPLARAEPGEPGAPAICAGRGSCPRGHTASIFIKLACHTGQISQRAAAAHVLQGSACLSSLGHVPRLRVGRARLASAPEKAQVWGFHPRPRGGEVHQLLECSCLPFATRRERTEKRQRDLERVPSTPSKFPANQAHACGPLRPGRQPSLRQEVSWLTGRPLFRVLPGSGCWLWPSGPDGTELPPDTAQLSEAGVPGPWAQRPGAHWGS